MEKLEDLLEGSKVKKIEDIIPILIGRISRAIYLSRNKNDIKEALRSVVKSGVFMVGGIIAKQIGDYLIETFSDKYMSTLDFYEEAKNELKSHLVALGDGKLPHFMEVNDNAREYFFDDTDNIIKSIIKHTKNNKSELTKEMINNDFFIRIENRDGYKDLVVNSNKCYFEIKNGKYLIKDIFRNEVHLIYLDFFNDKEDVYVFGKYHKDLSRRLEGFDKKYNKRYKTLRVKYFGEEDGKKVDCFKKITLDEKDINGIKFYDINASWGRTKTLDGIVFTEKEKLLNKIDSWILSKKTNAKFGISSSMGILLYGPHGTGKTSLVQALAIKYKTNLYYISPDLGNKKQALDTLYGKLSKSTELYDGIKCIVFIDEIDRFLNMKNTPECHSKEKEEIGSLLNQMLSGSKVLSDVLFIGATNENPGDFPADLMRKGRFGNHYKMDDINEKLSRKMCNFFEVDYDKVAEWYKEEHNKDLPLIPTELQEAILEYRQENILVQDESEEESKCEKGDDEDYVNNKEYVNVFVGENESALSNLGRPMAKLTEAEAWNCNQ